MKKNKFLLPFIIMLFSTAAFSQISVGGGITFNSGDGFDRMGISGRGIFGFSENVRGAVNFNIPFPEEQFGVKLRYFDLSADVHYVFPISDSFRVYGLAGYNRFTATVKVGSDKDSDSESGFAIGGGAEFQITESLALFGEPKYVIGDANRFILSLGVLYAL